MKKIIIIALFLFSLVLISQPLQVKGDYSYPPYEFINADGEPDGFNVELFEAIAQEMHLDYKLQLEQWSKVRSELENGEIDVLIGMTYSQERDKVVDFSIPHSYFFHTIFIRKDSPSINSINELEDKTVIVQKDDILHDYLIKKGIKNIITTDTPESSLKLLSSGKYDCALAIESQGMYIIEQLQLNNLKPTGEAFRPSKYCLAVKEGDFQLLHKINSGLQQLHTNGEYTRIYNKWFSRLQPQSWIVKVWVKYKYFLVGIIIILIAAVLIWHFTLEKLVKKRTMELEESELRWKFALEGAQQGVWDWRLDKDIIFFSTKWKKMLGYNEDEIENHYNEWKLRVHPEDIKQVEEDIKQHLQGKTPYYENLHRIQCKDGNYKWILARGKVVKHDAAGNPLRFIGTHQDFSEIKQLTSELQKERQVFKKISELSPVGIVIVDSQNHLEFCNFTTLTILGYTKAELTAQPLKPEFFEMRTFTDENIDPQQLPFYLAKEQKTTVCNYYMKVKTKQNQWIYVNINATPIFQDDKYDGIIATIQDISARLENEKELRANKKFAEEVIASANAMIVGLDIDGNVKIFNQVAEKITGYSKDEILNKNYFEIIVPKDRYPQPWNTFQEFKKQGNIKEFGENYILTKDGQEKLIYWRNNIIKSPDLGTFVITFGLDITEKKIMEQKLVNNEAKYRNLVERAQDGIAILQDHKITYANRALCKMLEYDYSQLVGMDFINIFHPQERKTIEKRYNNRMAGKESVPIYRSLLITKNNRKIVVEINAGLIEINGKNADQVIFRDLSGRIAQEKALEESKRQLTTLMNNLPGMAYRCSYDENWTMRFVSQGVFKLTGYTAEQILENTEISYNRLIIPEDRKYVKETIDKAVQQEKMFKLIYKIRTAQNTEKWVLEQGQAVRDKAGKIIALEGLVLDITDRKKYEQELDKLNRELEERIQQRTANLKETLNELEVFSYSVSHDLRAPLRAIEGFTQALVEDYADKFDKTGQDYAQRIIDSVKHMQELISDLLDYSRLSRKEISMSKIDLDKIVDTVLQNLQPELEAKEADIDIQKPLGTVKSNSTLLRQILINLLTNAVKFTKPGKKPQIKVDSKFRGKYIRLSIEDNGIGIKEEYQDKIFNIFERLHSSEDYAGNGIGLALVKKAARKLGGDCGVISDGKTGSTLWIDILNY